MNQYLIGSAITPSVLLVWFFHRRDLYPEPAKVLWATFILGVLTVVPVLIVVAPYGGSIDNIADPFLQGFVKAFAAAAIPEEFFKFLVVVLYCSRHKEFDEPMDGIVYGVVASLGFATLENILYVAEGGYSVALMRAFTAVPGHALTGAIMGYFVGQARFAPANAGRNWVLAFVVPTLLHGLYDFPLMAVPAYAASNDGQAGAVAWLLLVVLLLLIFEWIFAIQKMRHLRREQESMQPRPAAGPAASVQVSAALPGAAAAAQARGTAGRGTPKKNTALGVVYLVVGTLMAAFGGLMCLGLAVNVAEGTEDSTIGALIVAALLFAVLPSVLGMLMFRSGLRRANG